MTLFKWVLSRKAERRPGMRVTLVMMRSISWGSAYSGASAMYSSTASRMMAESGFSKDMLQADQTAQSSVVTRTDSLVLFRLRVLLIR